MHNNDVISIRGRGEKNSLNKQARLQWLLKAVSRSRFWHCSNLPFSIRSVKLKLEQSHRVTLLQWDDEDQQGAVSWFWFFSWLMVGFVTNERDAEYFGDSPKSKRRTMTFMRTTAKMLQLYFYGLIVLLPFNEMTSQFQTPSNHKPIAMLWFWNTTLSFCKSSDISDAYLPSLCKPSASEFPIENRGRTDVLLSGTCVLQVGSPPLSDILVESGHLSLLSLTFQKCVCMLLLAWVSDTETHSEWHWYAKWVPSKLLGSDVGTWSYGVMILVA